MRARPRAVGRPLGRVEDRGPAPKPRKARPTSTTGTGTPPAGAGERGKVPLRRKPCQAASRGRADGNPGFQPPAKTQSSTAGRGTMRCVRGDHRWLRSESLRSTERNRSPSTDLSAICRLSGPTTTTLISFKIEEREKR